MEKETRIRVCSRDRKEDCRAGRKQVRGREDKGDEDGAKNRKEGLVGPVAQGIASGTITDPKYGGLKLTSSHLDAHRQEGGMILPLSIRDPGSFQSRDDAFPWGGSLTSMMEAGHRHFRSLARGKKEASMSGENCPRVTAGVWEFPEKLCSRANGLRRRTGSHPTAGRSGTVSVWVTREG